MSALRAFLTFWALAKDCETALAAHPNLIADFRAFLAELHPPLANDSTPTPPPAA